MNKQEKTTLKKIAKSEDALLAKRATIILMADEGKNTAEIAQEVDFTTSTIQRWQRDFNRKGFEIFPASALNGDLLHPEAPQTRAVTAEAEPTEQPVTKSSKKDKSRQKKAKEKSKAGKE